MDLRSGEFAIGPDVATLRALTKRDGVAARVGHDLVIGFRDWSGTLVVDADDLPRSSLSVDIALGSFQVVSATGGLAGLSDSDRKEITGNAVKLLGVSRNPRATFRSDRVTPYNGGGSIEGTFRLNGTDTPLTLDVAIAGDALTAQGRVRQSALGIKPFSAMFGTLRVADLVGIEASVDLRRLID
jgi:polyisoprenoid-binding protein YceI